MTLPGAEAIGRLRRLPPWAVAAALYLLSAAILLWRLPADPPFPHNWEEYAAWNWFRFWEHGPQWREILRPTDGLMTDSGRNPLLGLPMAAGFSVFGIGLAGLRAPAGLIAALAPPLLWLAGRRMVPAPAALLAALMLALSPSFLVYARTGTLVGVSLVPMLLVVLALLLVLDAPPGRLAAPAAGLAIALLASCWAYAPVRLLWPVAVAALLVAAWSFPARRRGLLGAALAALVALPLALGAMQAAAGLPFDPAGAAVRAFHGRGETVLSMTDADYAVFLREDAPSADSPAARLVLQNARDLSRLAFDLGTQPTRREYWNASGSLWPTVWGLLAVVGALAALVRSARFRDGRLALLLAIAGAVTAPLLLTSRVHVGRLLPVLPWWTLLAACGAWSLAGWLAGWLRRRDPDSRAAAWVAPATATLVLLVAVGWLAREWRVAPTVTRQAKEAAALGALAPQADHGGVVLLVDPNLGSEIEQVHAASYRLQLDDAYRFLDLQLPRDDRPDGDGLPALRFHGALGLLEDGWQPRRACGIVYALQPEVLDAAEAALTALGCAEGPAVEVLPR